MEEKIIELNNYIDNLIDNAHEEYMKCSKKTEKVRLGAKIEVYWEIKNLVELILISELIK